MRSTILVALACLLTGAIGALGYSHYLGEGKRVAELQDELNAANASLAKATQDSQQTKNETVAMSAQIEQLTSTKDDLKKQVEELKSAAPDAAAPSAPTQTPGMSAMMKAGMAQHTEQQLILLKSRLHLTPEQEAAVKTALEDEAKRGEEMAAKVLAGGKIDPQAMAAEFKDVKSVDQTLNEILSPDQKTAYQQLKTDQKNSATETMATNEMNQISPLLQLSDSQKDQVYTALYQVQQNAQDPNWIKNNMTASPGSPANPSAFLDAQAKAKEDALAKILTPDQLATYHQQAQAQLDMQKSMMQNFSNGQVHSVFTVTQSPASAPAPAPAPAAPPAPAQAAPSNP